MSISRETVQHYAKLASLAFSEEETELLAGQLATILEHVRKISELDLSDVLPTSQVLDEGSRQREDAAAECLPVEAALANAPDRESGHFLVPKVISLKG